MPALPLSCFILYLSAALLQAQDAQRPTPAPAQTAATKAVPDGMVLIPGGTYRRGSEHKFKQTRAEYPEESPIHEVTFDGF
ncbi:MAG: hypothetical protein MK312_06160 [Roseibacillus sp.]|nr:hypothetical protein [Roseibacillus sp.]